MRLTFILPYAGLSGGVRVIVSLANALLDRGHDVAIFSHSKPLTTRLDQTPLSSETSLKPSFRPEIPIERSFFLGNRVSHSVINEARPINASDVPDADWIIATWYETADWVFRMPAEKGKKAFFIQQYETVFVPDRRREVDAAWSLPMLKLVCSQWLSDFAVRHFKAHPPIVIPNGVNSKLFFSYPRRRSNPPVLGFFYSHSPSKGLELCKNVISQVREKIPNLKIVSFGAFLPNKEYALPLDCEFHFCPIQSNLKDIYGKCDVWLCGSTTEGFHLPTHEAMACGCPVVSTEVGGPVDMIIHSVNGFLAPVGDLDGLVIGVLTTLLCSQSVWKSLSSKATITAKSFSWEDAANKFEQALVGNLPDKASVRQ